MGNLSKILEKVGNQNEIERDDINDVPKRQEKKQPAAPPSISQKNEKTEPSKVFDRRWNKRLSKAIYDDLSLPEVFKILRSRILHPLDDTTAIKTIMVTSAVPREGKSFVTANLGISLAQGMDQHSLLVDCDLRRPSLANLFGMAGNVGLVDHLRNQVQLSELIDKTGVEKLTLLASGVPPSNPAELLSSSRMRALVEELSCKYDDRIILFDTPPMLLAAETAVLAGLVDCVILVVRQGVSSKVEIQKVIDKIGKERIIGIVFNDHTGGFFEKSYGKGYGYYYSFGAGKQQ